MAVRNSIGTAVGAALGSAIKRPTYQSSGSAGGYSYGGGSSYSAPAPVPTSSYNLSIPDTAAPWNNSKQRPAALKNGASDKEKADYWIGIDDWWNAETESKLSYYNDAKRKLAQLEAQYPEYTKDQWQSQQILNARIAAAEAESRFTEAKKKADTISVNVGVSTAKDGDNERVEKTYTITDDTGNTVSTKYSEDNGGMSSSELRSKQERDQQKALEASTAAVRAEAAREVEGIQAGAERDYAVGAAESNREAWQKQYERDKGKIDSDYAGDRLEGNQDLLLASNETYNKAVQNSREASQILSQYNLGGSSLGGRLSQIAADAANNSNQVTALTYNQRMREADKNYGDANLSLEDENAKQQNAANQAKAQAEADYWARIAQQAGKGVEETSQYANSDYWYGTMFDNLGNRLNSFNDMDSQAMRDYSASQANRYQDYMSLYKNQQEEAAGKQTNTKADQYVSNYTRPAAKAYEAGLKAYKPVNSNSTILGESDKTQPKLEREDEGTL